MLPDVGRKMPVDVYKRQRVDGSFYSSAQACSLECNDTDAGRKICECLLYILSILSLIHIWRFSLNEYYEVSRHYHDSVYFLIKQEIRKFRYCNESIYQ